MSPELILDPDPRGGNALTPPKVPEDYLHKT